MNKQSKQLHLRHTSEPNSGIYGKRRELVGVTRVTFLWREDALRLVRDLTESTSDLVAENDRLRAENDELRADIRAKDDKL